MKPYRSNSIDGYFKCVPMLIFRICDRAQLLNISEAWDFHYFLVCGNSATSQRTNKNDVSCFQFIAGCDQTERVRDPQYIIVCVAFLM